MMTTVTLFLVLAMMYFGSAMKINVEQNQGRDIVLNKLEKVTFDLKQKNLL